MITAMHGDILFATTDAVVNPVNCIGISGRGLAFQFKQHFPDYQRDYETACRQRDVRPGHCHFYRVGPPRPAYNWIISFPTKRHWRDRSQIDDIRDGLANLSEGLARRKIPSVAIPPIGCGLGGLDYLIVRPMIEAAFADTGIDLTLYTP
jgi:O-acetyl-ADP-ribose deacetylase (regulator of RNase III)